MCGGYTFLSLESRTVLADTFWDSLPCARRPALSGVVALASNTCLHTTDDGTTLLVRKFAPLLIGSSGGRNTRLPFSKTPRTYVPMLVRPWVPQACRANAFFHLGTARTLRMLEPFHWWIGMGLSVRWWLRHRFICQARKTSLQTYRWPTLTLPLPNGPGIVVSVEVFGPLPVASRGNAYILLFTDCFNRRVDRRNLPLRERLMFSSTATCLCEVVR